MKGTIDPKITYKVKRQLTKLCAGDITQMQRVLDVVCGENSGSDYKHYLDYLSKPMAHYEFENPYDLAIRACNQIRKRKLTVTTEKPSPQPKTDTTENDSIQLALDFSATTEPIQTAPADEPTQKPAPSPSEGEKRSQVMFPNESIFLAISRAGTGKGWLTPQYKFKIARHSNSTSTDPYKICGRTFGPYWIFCWNRPKKNDGHYYLGKVESPKFQHFCEIWKSSEDLSEILRRLYAR